MKQKSAITRVGSEIEFNRIANELYSNEKGAVFHCNNTGWQLFQERFE